MRYLVGTVTFGIVGLVLIGSAVRTGEAGGYGLGLLMVGVAKVIWGLGK